MAKLPNSFRKTNRTTRQFRAQLADLPAEILDLTKKACRLFHENPAHRSLRHHELRETKKGQHHSGSYSVSINMQYRAIYLQSEDGVNVWYWIGSHADYDVFVGSD